MKIIFSVVLLLYSCLVSANFTIDKKLDLIINLYNLKPKDCSVSQYSSVTHEEINLGKKLFETVLLSGNKDTSCSTCHLDDFGSSDGLPLSVGVGGKGENTDRYVDGNGILVQRNSFSLFGRGHTKFKNYFWDGKLDTHSNGSIISQLGSMASDIFEAPLSLASILPLLERDEFLGKNSIFIENRLQNDVGDKLYYQRYLSLSKSIRDRINKDADANHIKTEFVKQGIDVDNLELAHIGNLIGKFIADKFKCHQSQWDKYLGGDHNAISKNQKLGAILFYGKGRCSACHSGVFFSDFKFHSIAVPQGQFGPHSRHRDLGRAAVTLKQGDLFRFRTPPLIGVSKTAPYAHNGIFETLDETIRHHINPIDFFLNQNNSKYNNLSYGKILNTRDPILTSISITSDKEIYQLLEFLNAL